MKDLDFEFYVMNYDVNAKKLVRYNIFNNYYVYNGALKAVVKYLSKVIKYDEFKEELDEVIMHEMWSRCQYEIIAGDMFAKDMSELQKIDCYAQCKDNIDVIARSLIGVASDFFYDEDSLYKWSSPECVRDHIVVNTLKNKVYDTMDEARAAITEDDLLDADGDRFKYENWYLKGYVRNRYEGDCD